MVEVILLVEITLPLTSEFRIHHFQQVLPVLVQCIRLFQLAQQPDLKALPLLFGGCTVPWVTMERNWS
jgi:hypothetical protein